MNKKEVEALTREAVKGIKTEQDLNDFSRNGCSSKTLMNEDGQFDSVN